MACCEAHSQRKTSSNDRFQTGLIRPVYPPTCVPMPSRTSILAVLSAEGFIKVYFQKAEVIVYHHMARIYGTRRSW